MPSPYLWLPGWRRCNVTLLQFPDEDGQVDAVCDELEDTDLPAILFLSSIEALNGVFNKITEHIVPKDVVATLR